MTDLGRRAAWGMVSLTVAVSAVLLSGGTASAAPGDWQCPAGYSNDPTNEQMCLPNGQNGGAADVPTCPPGYSLNPNNPGMCNPTN